MHTAMNEVVMVWVVALSAASVLTRAWSHARQAPFDASAVGAEALPTPGRSVPGSDGGPESGGPPVLGSEVGGGKQAAIVARLANAASRRGLVLFMVFAPCRGSFTTPPLVCGTAR